MRVCTFLMVTCVLVTASTGAPSVAKPVQPAEAAPPAEPLPTPQQAEQIAKLIVQLGDDDFAVREAAHEKLAELGAITRAAVTEAAKSPDPEVAVRARSLLKQLGPVPGSVKLADAEVYVIGLYEGDTSNVAVQQLLINTRTVGEAAVTIKSTEKPVLLVVCAYEPVKWKIELEPGARLAKVIASGYHQQTVNGVRVPVETSSHDQGSRDAEGQPLYFHAHKENGPDFLKLKDDVQKLTGKPILLFQGAYRYPGVPFVIGKE